MRNILFSCLFLFCCFSMAGKVPSKQKIRLTDNWEYLKGDLGGIWDLFRPQDKGVGPRQKDPVDFFGGGDPI